jgi:hypothetical protein
MSQQYPGGFITKSPPALNPAMGNAAPGVWTMDQVTQAIKNGTWPAYDPYFENVTLLLHGNGTNGAQNNTFIDGSSNAFTITRNGNTTQGTFSPFSVGASQWSNYFDGSGDYLGNTSSALITQNVSTFTIEGWIYMTANPTSDANNISGFITVDGQPANTFNYMAFGPISSRVLYLRWFDGAGKTANGSTTLNLNQWYHIACVVNSNAIQFYVNGVAETMSGTTTLTNRNGTAGNFSVGSHYYGAIAGYLSNVRVTTTAVYTAGFTTPTSPLTAITNTSLLTCQSNRFIDNSSNAYALTVGGNTSVQAFSPFAPTAAYSASTIGGSGYFDGTGDYLSVPDNNAFSLGTNNFSIEAWIYPTATGNYPLIFAQYSSASNSIFFSLGNANTNLECYIYGSTNINLVATSAITLNAWQHVAIVRNGNTFTLYRNGISVATNTTSLTITDSTSKVTIGAAEGPAPYPFFGYISNLRVVNGTAVYTANFTPPTSPVTAITNTQLLCDFTNASIIDNAMMNDLETVGNAQISTTQSKFGGSSMAFDGAGDYLTIPSSQNFNFGTGNFTVEFWYRTAATGTHTIIDNNYATAPNFTLQPISGSMKLYVNGSATVLTESSTHSANVWYHYAFVRSGSTITMYRDGTSVASATYSGAVGNGSVPTYIGGSLSGGGYYVNGYIDDLRITKGVARYTANFTPQTSQWQDQ